MGEGKEVDCRWWEAWARREKRQWSWDWGVVVCWYGEHNRSTMWRLGLEMLRHCCGVQEILLVWPSAGIWLSGYSNLVVVSNEVVCNSI